MRRRAFIGSAGAALSVGLLGRRFGDVGEEIAVRVWFSDSAAEYETLESRVRGYLQAALEPGFDAISVDVAGTTVSLPSEDGKAILSRHWPRLVLEGAARLSGIDPVDGVNLLVTDGDPTKQPSGYARPHIAASTGAGRIAEMPPAKETPAVVPYSLESAATQLLLHECGHALGIGHDHGTAQVRNGVAVASPMVSSYLWAAEDVRGRHLDDSGNTCGELYPTVSTGTGRRLKLRYSKCALDALREARE